MSIQLLDRPATIEPAPVLDDVTRRQFLAGLAAAGLLAGCGSDASPPPSSSAAPATQVVDTPRGSVEVPVRPQRIVAIDEFALDAALAVGITPVGAAYTGVDDPAVAHFGDRMSEIEPISTADGLNVERILALAPDLILAVDDPLYDDVYAELAMIAPTALFPDFSDAGRWEEYVAAHAQLIAGQGAAATIDDGLEAKVAEAKAALGDLGGLTAQVFKPYADVAYLYLRDSFVGQLLDRVGFAPVAEEPASRFTQELSYEQLDRLQADVVFVLVASAKADRERFDRLADDALWQQLPAVQQGRAFEIDPHWIRAGYISAGLVFDDLRGRATQIVG